MQDDIIGEALNSEVSNINNSIENNIDPVNQLDSIGSYIDSKNNETLLDKVADFGADIKGFGSAVGGYLNKYNPFAEDEEDYIDVEKMNKLNNDSKVTIEYITNDKTLTPQQKTDKLNDIQVEYNSNILSAYKGDTEEEKLKSMKQLEDFNKERQDEANFQKFKYNKTEEGRISLYYENTVNKLFNENFKTDGSLDADRGIMMKAKNSIASNLTENESNKRKAIAVLVNQGLSISEAEQDSSIKAYDENHDNILKQAKFYAEGLGRGMTGEDAYKYAGSSLGLDTLGELSNFERRGTLNAQWGGISQKTKNLLKGNINLGNTAGLVYDVFGNVLSEATELVSVAGSGIGYVKDVIIDGENATERATSKLATDQNELSLIDKSGWTYGLTAMFYNLDDIIPAAATTVRTYGMSSVGYMKSVSKMNELLNKTKRGLQITNALKESKLAGQVNSRMSDVFSSLIGDYVVNTSIGDINNSDQLLVDTTMNFLGGALIDGLMRNVSSLDTGLLTRGIFKTDIDDSIAEFLKVQRVDGVYSKADQDSIDGLSSLLGTYLQKADNQIYVTNGDKKKWLKKNALELQENGFIQKDGLMAAIGKQTIKADSVIDLSGYINNIKEGVKYDGLVKGDLTLIERKFSKINGTDPVRAVLSGYKKISQDKYNKLLSNDDFKVVASELTDARASILSRIDVIKTSGVITDAVELKNAISEYDEATNKLASKLGEEYKTVTMFDSKGKLTTFHENELTRDGYKFTSESNPGESFFLKNNVRQEILGDESITADVKMMINDGVLSDVGPSTIINVKSLLENKFNTTIGSTKNGDELINIYKNNGRWEINVGGRLLKGLGVGDFKFTKFNKKGKKYTEHTVELKDLRDHKSDFQIYLYNKILNSDNLGKDSLEDLLTSELIAVKKAVKDGDIIDNAFSFKEVSEVQDIAKKDLESFTKSVFTEEQNIELSSHLDRLIYNRKNSNLLSKMFQGSKDIAESSDKYRIFGAIIDNLGLRITSNFHKNIDTITKLTNSDLSKGVKELEINKLLLGTDSKLYNTFLSKKIKYTDKIKKQIKDVTGNNPGTDAYKTTEKSLKTFLDTKYLLTKKDLISKLGEEKGLKEYNELIKGHIENFSKLRDDSMNLYLNNVIESITSNDIFTKHKAVEVKIIKKVEGENREGVIDIINSISELRNGLTKSNVKGRLEELETLYGDLSLINKEFKLLKEEDKILRSTLNDFSGYIKKPQSKLPEDINEVITLGNKIVDRLSTEVDKNTLDADSIGDLINKEGDTIEIDRYQIEEGGDNLFYKAFTKLLNPTNTSKINNKGIQLVINDFFKKQFNVDLLDLNKQGDILLDDYSKRFTKEFINGGLKDILYNTDGVKGWDINKQGIKKNKNKSQIFNELLTNVHKEIELSDITIIDNGKSITGKEAADIIMKDFDAKSIVDILINRSRKVFNDNILVMKDGKFVKGSKIIDDRTIFSKLENQKLTPIEIEGGGLRSYRKTPNLDSKDFKLLFDKAVINADELSIKVLNDISNMNARDFHKHTLNVIYFLENSGILKNISEDNAMLYTAMLGINPKFINEGKTTFTKSIQGNINNLKREFGSTEGYINTLNIGDKESLGIMTSKENINFTNNGVNKYSDYFSYAAYKLDQEKQFGDKISKEFGFTKRDGVKGFENEKIVKRLSTLVAPKDPLVPGLDLDVRNYIMTEKAEGYYEFNKFDNKGNIIGDDIWEKLVKLGDSDSIDDQKEFIKLIQEKYPDGVKNYGITDLGIDDAKMILKDLTTPYTDGISLMSDQQIELYSKYLPFVHKGQGMKFHYYHNNDTHSILGKTHFQPLSQFDSAELTNHIGKTNDSNIRVIGEESLKIEQLIEITETEFKKLKLEGEDKYRYKVKLDTPKTIWNNGTPHKVEYFIEGNSKFDRVASKESHVDENTNGITKQVFNRINPIAQRLITINKVDTFNKFVDKNLDIGLKDKLTSNSFNKFGRFLNRVHSKLLGNEGAAHIPNEYLGEQIQKLGGIIETPRDPGLGHRSYMYPMRYRTQNGNRHLIRDDEIVVDKNYISRIEKNNPGSILTIKNSEGVEEHFVATYRSPVPSKENVTLNKIVVDDKLNEGAVAISPLNTTANKQGDFDGDHINILFVTNKKGDNGGQAVAFSKILDNQNLITDSKLNDKIDDISRRLLSGEEYSDELSKEIDSIVVAGIKNLRKDNATLPQNRVFIEQVSPLEDTGEVIEKTLSEYNSNASIGKDNIAIVDSTVRSYNMLSSVADTIKEMKRLGVDQIIIDTYRNKIKKELNGLVDDGGELLGFIEQMGSSKEFSGLSQSIIQRTLDAAKVGNLPEGWETLLINKFNFSDEVNDNILSLINKLGSRGNKMYNYKDKLNFGTAYDSGRKQTVVSNDGLLGNQEDIFKLEREKIGDIREKYSTLTPSGIDKFYYGLIKGEGLSKVEIDKSLKEITKGFIDRLSKTELDTLVLSNNKGKDLELKQSSIISGLLSTTGKDFSFSLPHENIIKQIKLSDYIKGQGATYDILEAFIGKMSDKGVGIKYGKYGKADIYIENNDKFWEYISQNTDKNTNDYQAIRVGNSKGLDKDKLSGKEFMKYLYYTTLLKLPELKGLMSGGKLEDYIDILTKKQQDIIIKKSSLDEGYKELLDTDISKLVEDFNKLDNIKQTTEGLILDGTTIKKDKIGETIKIKGVDYILEEDGLYKSDGGRSFYEINNVVDSLKEYKPAIGEKGAMIKDLTGYNIGELNIKAEMLSDAYDEIQKNALFTTRKFVNRNFKEESLRNAELQNNASNDLYIAVNDLKKKYSKTITDKVRIRHLDNLLFYGYHVSGGELDGKSLLHIGSDNIKNSLNEFLKKNKVKGKAVTDIEEQYILEVYDLVHGPLKDYIRDVKLNFPSDFPYEKVTSSLIDDISRVGIRTEKLAYYEKGIFDEESFMKYWQKKDSNGEYIRIDGANTKLGNSLYEQIFEFDQLGNPTSGVGKFAIQALKKAREFTYQTQLGYISNLAGVAGMTVFKGMTGFTGFVMGVSQLAGEALRTYSGGYNKFKGSDLMDVMDKYKILDNTGIKSTLEFGYADMDASAADKLLTESFRKIYKGAGGDLESEKFTKKMVTQILPSFILNPLSVTDVTLDRARKLSSLDYAIGLGGFKDIDEFTTFIDNADSTTSLKTLNTVRAIASQKFEDITGGVISGSMIGKETRFTRGGAAAKTYNLTLGFLMSWSNHVIGTLLEDGLGTIKNIGSVFNGNKGSRVKALGDLLNDDGLSKIVNQTVMAAALTTKINNHDDYKQDSREDLGEYIMTLNSNLTALSMFFPTSTAGTIINSGEGHSLYGNILEATSGTLRTMFRELGLGGEIVKQINYMVKQGKSFEEAITDAVNSKTQGTFIRNRVGDLESMYTDFDERSSMTKALFADVPSYDEKIWLDTKDFYENTLSNDIISNGRYGTIFTSLMWDLPLLNKMKYLGSKEAGLHTENVMKINEYIKGKTFKKYLGNSKSMLDTIYDKGGDQAFINVFNLLQKPGSAYGSFDSETLQQNVGFALPTQFTEAYLADKVIDKLGEEQLRKLLGDNQGQQYGLMLLEKLKIEDPAILPYVTGVLMRQDFYLAKTADRKAVGGGKNYKANPERMAQMMKTIADKYTPYFDRNTIALSGLYTYTAVAEKPEFKDRFLTAGKGETTYLKNHILNSVVALEDIRNKFKSGDISKNYINSRISTMLKWTANNYDNGDITKQQYDLLSIDTIDKAVTAIMDSEYLNDNKKRELVNGVLIQVKDRSIFDKLDNQDVIEKSKADLIKKFYKIDYSEIKDSAKAAEGIQARYMNIPGTGSYGRGGSGRRKSYSRLLRSNYQRKQYGKSNNKGYTTPVQKFLRTPIANTYDRISTPFTPTVRNVLGFNWTPQHRLQSVRDFRIMIDGFQKSNSLVRKTRKGKPTKVFFRTRKSEGVRVQDKKQSFSRIRSRQRSLIDLNKD